MNLYHLCEPVFMLQMCMYHPINLALASVTLSVQLFGVSRTVFPQKPSTENFTKPTSMKEQKLLKPSSQTPVLKREKDGVASRSSRLHTLTESQLGV